MRRTQRDFLKELEQVLEENKQLKQSAVVPPKMAPVAEWIVFHPVVTLTIGAFVITLVLFMTSPNQFLQLVEAVLFIHL